MTGVLAAAARAVLTVVAGAVLLLACAAAMLWPTYGPQGAWTLAWLAVVFAVVAGAVLGVSALQPKGDGDRADTP